MMRLMLVLLMCLIATPVSARYIALSFSPVTGATKYTLYWGSSSGSYPNSVELLPDAGTVKWDINTTYYADDRVVENNYSYRAKSTITAEGVLRMTTWYQPPDPIYNTTTNMTAAIPVDESTIYMVVTATDGTGESAYSDEIVFLSTSESPVISSGISGAGFTLQ